MSYQAGSPHPHSYEKDPKGNEKQMGRSSQAPLSTSTAQTRERKRPSDGLSEAALFDESNKNKNVWHEGEKENGSSHSIQVRSLGWPILTLTQFRISQVKPLFLYVPLSLKTFNASLVPSQESL